MYREQKSLFRLHFLWNHAPLKKWNYAPLKVLVGKSCPLNNLETHGDYFAKLSANIKHDQIICRG